jgi:hypothetical protein
MQWYFVDDRSVRISDPSEYHASNSYPLGRANCIDHLQKLMEGVVTQGKRKPKNEEVEQIRDELKKMREGEMSMMKLYAKTERHRHIK